jgi:hypothetical protein
MAVLKVKSMAMVCVIVMSCITKTAIAQTHFVQYLSNNNLGMGYVDLRKMAEEGRFEYWRNLLPVKTSKNKNIRLFQSVLGGDDQLGVDFRSLIVFAFDAASSEFYIPLKNAKNFHKNMLKGAKTVKVKLGNQQIYVLKSSVQSANIVAWNDKMAVVFHKPQHNMMSFPMLLEYLFTEKTEHSILSDPYFARFWNEPKDAGVIAAPQLWTTLLSDERIRYLLNEKFWNQDFTLPDNEDIFGDFLQSQVNLYLMATLSFEKGKVVLDFRSDGSREDMTRLHNETTPRQDFDPRLLTYLPPEADLYLTINTDILQTLKNNPLLAHREEWWLPCLLNDSIRQLSMVYAGLFDEPVFDEYASRIENASSSYYMVTFSTSDTTGLLQTLQKNVIDINRSQAFQNEQEERTYIMQEESEAEEESSYLIEEYYRNPYFQYVLSEDTTDLRTIYTLHKIKIFNETKADTVKECYIVFDDNYGILTNQKEQVRHIGKNVETQSGILNQVRDNSHKIIYMQTASLDSIDWEQKGFPSLQDVIFSVEPAHIVLQVNLSQQAENSLYYLLQALLGETIKWELGK